jgi:uncharacterized membrane protein
MVQKGTVILLILLINLVSVYATWVGSETEFINNKYDENESINSRSQKSIIQENLEYYLILIGLILFIFALIFYFKKTNKNKKVIRRK